MKTEEKTDGAFKNWINASMLKRMEDAIRNVHPAFPKKALLRLAPKLHALELKARVQLIRDALYQNLPSEFPKALRILLQSLKNGDLDATDLWPYSEYIQTHGLGHFEVSMNALYQLTPQFTSEFAVRPFLVKHQKMALQKLLTWSSDPSEDIRRWASEGTRPRLPWGLRLKDFIENPQLTLPILEKLKYDDALYVRKSVANHLNDIAKDHPQVVIDLLKKWTRGAPKVHQEKINWITRHSLRTLIKKGNPQALFLMGVDLNAKVKLKNFKLNLSKYKLNDVIEMDFEIHSQDSKSRRLIVDYIVHHQKSNGSTSPKVFKLKTIDLAGKESVSVSKKHSLKPVTTRKYYPGEHFIEIQVNGNSLGKVRFTLVS